MNESSPSGTAPCFIPEQYLSGLIERAIQPGIPVCIEHVSLGKILIDPASQCFFLLSQQPDALYRAPVSQLTMTPATLPAACNLPHGHLEDLRWAAAWHASEGRLLPDTSLYDVLQMSAWPNLTRLPATPEVMRLCALLNRQPHCLHLAHHLLGVSREDSCRFYCAAWQAGLLVRLSHTAAGSSLPPAAPAEPEPETPSLLLILHQLWDRLTRRTR